MSASKPHSMVGEIGTLTAVVEFFVSEAKPQDRGGKAYDALRKVEGLIEQLEAAREALFACYVASGADTDGARSLSDMGRIDPPIEVLAVRAVEDLRLDYDEDPNPASSPPELPKSPFQKVVDDLTNGCGCACHTGTGYRSSCEHCFPASERHDE